MLSSFRLQSFAQELLHTLSSLQQQSWSCDREVTGLSLARYAVEHGPGHIIIEETVTAIIFGRRYATETTISLQK